MHETGQPVTAEARLRPDPAAITWSAGQVRGPRTLPVTIL